MDFGHTILLYVAITAVMFIALDGLIESDQFSILKHNLPTQIDEFDSATGTHKQSSLETRYAMVRVFFEFTIL
jgi:hypothetical protein